MKKTISLILFLLLCVTGNSLRAQQNTGAFPFRDPSLPLQERVSDLVSRMTLQEKVDQLVYTAPAIPRLGIPAYTWWQDMPPFFPSL